MADNMVSYAKKYFGLDYDRMPFTEIDSLILSQVVYFNYKGTLFEGEDFVMSLQEFLKENPDNYREWEMPYNEDEALTRLLKMGGRHGSLKGCHYLGVKDAEAEKQYGALTFELKKGLYYMAFRGTDNSVTGWKEDLNLTYQDAIPAQKDALIYATKVMEQYEGEFYLGGHSKGGNLAVYTAMNLPEELQNRVTAVYDHDGPGFADHVFESEKYKKIRPLIHKTVPESSMIGVLWQADPNYKVVKSKVKGMGQHIAYTWLTEDDKLVEVPDTDRFSKNMKKILERFVDELEPDERKRFIDSVFDAIENTEVERFQELRKERFKKMKLLLEGLTELEPEERKHVLKSFKQLLKISAEEIKE